MKISRRNMLKISAGTGAAAVLLREFPALAQEQPLLVRSIPSSGEEIPAVGLGSARTFSVGASGEERAPLKEVLRLFHEMGGRFFDTAPTYGSSESVSGQLIQEPGIQNDLFFATKISTGGGMQAGIDQQETSLQDWGRDSIDLNQVHNKGYRTSSEDHPTSEGRGSYTLRRRNHLFRATVRADGAGTPDGGTRLRAGQLLAWRAPS